MILRRFASITLIGLTGLLLCASAALSHPEGETDLPDLASEPSDPIQVHRSHERLRLVGFAGNYQSEQAGCPAYDKKFDETGELVQLDPAFRFCATDRMSMYEHRKDCKVIGNPDAARPDCFATYADRAIEQVMPTGFIRRGRSVPMYGVLYKQGEPEPSQNIVIERWILGLEEDFSTMKSQKTASIGEIGSARVSDTATSIAMYRWGVKNSSGLLIYNTVPYVSRVVPTVLGTNVSKRKVRRQEAFTVTVRTDVPIWSTVRLEYRVGKRWVQVNRISAGGRSRFPITGRINRTSGKFAVRVTIDPTRMPNRPWYDGVSAGVGAVSIISDFTIIKPKGS